MYKNRDLSSFPKVLLVCSCAFASLCQAAIDSYNVSPGEYRVTANVTNLASTNATQLLGTHSLWWGHQADLWVRGTRENDPVVTQFFKTTGGTIRYGGGANEISYKACSGPYAKREVVKAVVWAKPMRCQFGVPEYLATVRASAGKQAWLIANLAGINHTLFTEAELVSETGFASASLRSEGKDLQRYWELGNELERGRYGWSPEMIARRASMAGAEILRNDPDAKLILPLIEYNDPRQPARKLFNERLIKSMTQDVSGVALHLYYDGAPGGPSIPTQLNTVVETAGLFKRIKGKPAAIWITEHGRWPEGDTDKADWKSSWYKTNDIDGVIGTADFLIGLSQIGAVSGAMLHGLRAGPWNVFDKTPTEVELSGVGKLLTLLADSKPKQRLVTVTSSQNQSAYKGGYDLRAAAFETDLNDGITYWLVNRAPTTINVSVDFSQTQGFTKFQRGKSLICPLPNGRCSGYQFRMFDMRPEQVVPSTNSTTVTLPGRSVSTVTFFKNE